MAGGEPTRKDIEALVRSENPQLFANLNATKKNQVVDAVAGVLQRVEFQHTQTITHHSGPLPPSQELARYNEVCPGAADRIIAMAERQSAHRIELEKLVVGNQQQQSNRGQAIAAILVVCLIVAGIFAIVYGLTSVAITIFGTTIVGVASLYIYGQVSQKRNLTNKNQKAG